MAQMLFTRRNVVLALVAIAALAVMALASQATPQAARAQGTELTIRGIAPMIACDSCVDTSHTLVYLGLKVRDVDPEPLMDSRIREAIWLATDQSAMAGAIPDSEPGSVTWPGAPGAPADPHETSALQCGLLFTQAGFPPDSIRRTFPLAIPAGDGLLAAVAGELVDQLAECGLTVEIQPQPLAEFNEDLVAGTYEWAFLNRIEVREEDPWSAWDALFHSESEQNFTGLPPEVDPATTDDLIADLEAATSDTAKAAIATTLEELVFEREGDYFQVQPIIWVQ